MKLSRTQAILASLSAGFSQLPSIDDIQSAKRELQRAAALGELSPMTESQYRWFLAKARVADAEGDPLEASRLLVQAQQLYLPGLYPRLRPIPAVQARVWSSR